MGGLDPPIQGSKHRVLGKEVEKSRFVEVAPRYYALAICVVLRSAGGLLSLEEIQNSYQYREDDNFEPESLLRKDPVFEAAIAWLSERGMIESLLDDFGPPIYQRSDDFDDGWNDLVEQPGSVFHKYAALTTPGGWLYDALRALVETYDRLQISPEDFGQPEDEWQPLPLERGDESLTTAIASLEDTMRLVRADNGYSVAHPEERAYVLSSLSSTLETLRTATTTSIVFLKKNALEPLQRLALRFGTAAIGMAAEAARADIVEFLKQFGSAVIKHFLGP
jgi:hypothetical protein